MSSLLGHYNYWIVILLMMVGFYIVISRGNLVKKIIGLHIFHSQEFEVYSNPLPSVLILTAIVVGVATMAVALSLVVRIREAYGTIEEDDIAALEEED